VLSTLLFFILSVSILVTFHEYGHYFVARLFGVKVLRFSIGFGKSLLKWRNRHGTEFTIALIPLGGYVKMLEASDVSGSQEDKRQAFEYQPLFARTLIVLAGPLFNFLLAILLYTIIYVVGFQTFSPIVGTVTPNSLAAQAEIPERALIVSWDNQTVDSWRQVTMRLLSSIGSQRPIPLSFQDLESGQSITRTLSLKTFVMEESRWPVEQLGIQPMEPPMPAVIDAIAIASPAEEAGLQPNDRILSIDNQPIMVWPEVVATVQKHPAETLRVTVLRQERLHSFNLTPKTNEQGLGYIGVSVQALKEPYVHSIKYTPGAALLKSTQLIWDYSILSLKLFYKMISGQISVAHLSGPISIAQGAESSASLGFMPFLSFLALLSVSLGVVNLLPIPTLDGGHLLYYGCEAILRRPVSVRVQQIGLRIGFSLLIGLMLIAITNDLMRVFSLS
jgi:regulator of sigma E protease